MLKYIIKDNPENLGLFIPHRGLTEEVIERKYPSYVKLAETLTEHIKYYRWDGGLVLKDNFQALKDTDELQSELSKFPGRKRAKYQEIKEAFITATKRPQVDTTLGYSVDGNYQDLQNFQTALALNAAVIRDADNNARVISPTDLDTIIQKIQENGSALYQRKWDLDAAIKVATTVGELETIEWGQDGI